MKYVVDTNIFNKLLDGDLLPINLPSDGEFIATHIQIDELNNTKNIERRAQLFLVFATIAPRLVPTESFALGISRLNQAKLSKKDNLAKVIKNDLDGLNGGKSNNIQDALIAEVAKKHGINFIYLAT